MPWTNQQNKEHKLSRVSKGLCEQCGNPRGTDGTTLKCRSCADKMAKRVEDKRRQKGVLPKKILEIPWIKGTNCKICRKDLPEGRHTQRCEACSEVVNDAASVKKKERHTDKMCQTCGREKPITQGKYYLCHICYLRAAACRHLGSTTRWKELRDLWDKQKGICPYTGKNLTIGVDASIDHIHPQKRYPELKHDIKNVEWVDFSINIMKRDRTKEEFLQLLDSIQRYTRNA